jgi:hypothetical protein
MVMDSNRFKICFVKFFVDNVPVVENWMLGMCDVADCINDVRDPETIRFSDLFVTFKSLHTSSVLSFIVLRFTEIIW